MGARTSGSGRRRKGTTANDVELRAVVGRSGATRVNNLEGVGAGGVLLGVNDDLSRAAGSTSYGKILVSKWPLASTISSQWASSLTDEGIDGLEVAAGTVLQENGD